jgi:ArsR family transcriptional regulator, virulence genes transcriptional regulator
MNENLLQLFKMQADICKTLADPKRLMIIHELRSGELPVGEIAARLNMPQANVSQHLAILRKHAIVATRREGTSVYYSLAGQKIADACDMVRSVLSEQLEHNQSIAKFMKTQ